jgi:sugar phosphate isomerase/epimerase
VAIENHDRFRSRVLADIIQRTGSPFVGICLDTANSLGANEGITEVLDNLASLTVNLHLKDIRIARKPHMMGFDISGAPVCEGALDIPGIMRRLQSNGHNPNAILELWPPFSETIEKTIEIERDWIRRSIQNLRALT